MTSIAHWAVAMFVGLSATSLLISGCSSDKHFSVGDCVTAKMGVGSDDINETECRKTTIQEKLDDKSVYRISKIVGLRDRCPGSTDVRFSDEPNNATYCLIQY